MCSEYNSASVSEASMVRSLFIVTLLVLHACGPGTPAPSVDVEDILGIDTAWKGTFACADCAGIEVELTLDADLGKFALQSTYRGTRDGDKTYIRNGRTQWNQSVLCLNVEPPNPTECYFMQDVYTLVRLDMAGEVTADELRRQ